MIAIGITGTGSLIGQAIIKSILRSDLKNKVELTGFDYFRDTVGSFWCHQNHLLPDLLDINILTEKWLAAVTDQISSRGIKILFVGVDFELIKFAKFKQEIYKTTGCRVVVCDPYVIEIADDKYLTAEFLKEHGLTYPSSYLSVEAAKEEIFPMIVKPRVGARSRGVSLVNNQEELRIAVDGLSDPVIQECVGDHSTEYTCGVIFLDNEVKHTIALKRTLKEGNTFLSYYSKKDDDQLRPYLVDVANALKPEGSCNFQLRLDSNNVPKIFEINARHSGTTYVRSLFGYYEIEYIIKYYLGMKLPEFQVKEGTVVRFFEEFFVQ